MSVFNISVKWGHTYRTSKKRRKPFVYKASRVFGFSRPLYLRRDGVERHIATPAKRGALRPSASGSQLSVDGCGFAADLQRAGECLPPVRPSASRSPPLWRASPPPRFARLPLPFGLAGSEGLRRWVTRSVIHGRWVESIKQKSIGAAPNKSGCQPQRGGDVRFLRVLFPQTPDSRQQGEKVN